MKKISFLIVLLLILGNLGFAQGSDLDADLKSAESFIDRNDGLSLKKFESILESNPDNFTALFQASLLNSRIGNRLSTKEAKAKMFRKAKDLADRAIKANPNSPEGFYVMGVALGRIALIAGTKERVGNVRKIKKNAEEALRLDNQHGGAWHLLGRIHTKVATASKAEKIAANTFFGGLPKGCNLDRAIECYNYALKFQPDYILFMFDKAEAEYFNDQFSESKSTLQAILKTKNKTEDDPNLKKAAQEMLDTF